MIAFDLRCAGQHVFEAWFASSAAYEEQRASGLLMCPVCGDGDIAKAVMAPNVAAKGNRAAATAPPAVAIKQVMAAIAAEQAKALESSQWVGMAFADQARAMHLGDTPPASIHGQTTRDEARALIDEGVPVAPLLVPVVPPEARN
ncbi:DUF1178 family protein [Sphingomonas sp.]|uniref:DUF1178 family protein n=1 Tax=Sphingomonas sp. TaxID=28214 RepID=UPI002B8FE73A|nr:DUF1178 family protein [Sphingomonas sp.]HWK36469.1 DUF1178 family protein [Sphingomonas sp.]